jgi:hypothetical protein
MVIVRSLRTLVDEVVRQSREGTLHIIDSNSTVPTHAHFHISDIRCQHSSSLLLPHGRCKAVHSLRATPSLSIEPHANHHYSQLLHQTKFSSHRIISIPQLRSPVQHQPNDLNRHSSRSKYRTRQSRHAALRSWRQIESSGRNAAAGSCQYRRGNE